MSYCRNRGEISQASVNRWGTTTMRMEKPLTDTALQVENRFLLTALIFAVITLGVVVTSLLFP